MKGREYGQVLLPFVISKGRFIIYREKVSGRFGHVE